MAYQTGWFCVKVCFDVFNSQQHAVILAGEFHFKVMPFSLWKQAVEGGERGEVYGHEDGIHCRAPVFYDKQYQY